MPGTKKKSTEPIINIFSKEEIEKWCKKLNCDRTELLNAILTAGKKVKQVKGFLKKHKKANGIK